MPLDYIRHASLIKSTKLQSRLMQSDVSDLIVQHPVSIRYSLQLVHTSYVCEEPLLDVEFVWIRLQLLRGPPLYLS